MIFTDQNLTKHKAGYIMLSVLVFASLAIILLSALANWAALNYRLATQTVDRERAFQIAEAGLDYYRWHLAHAPTDYYDGRGASSTWPSVHNYYDKMGDLIGFYKLTITAPSVGSSVVTIRSQGIVASSSVSRTLETVLAIPSLAKYAFVSNSAMRFGEGTEVYGPMHSNGGIRFDGVAHNLVTSALSSYDDPDHTGNNEFGVHTHVSPTGSYVSDSGLSSELASNSTVPLRTDVFLTGRSFPVPAVDWSGFTQDLATLKTLAQSSSGRYFPSSGYQGYYVVLKTNGTFELYKVTSLVSAPSGCSKPTNSDGQTGWGTWSIKNKTSFGTYSFPANGVIFFEDNVWIDGQISGARLTIASGRFPESDTTNTSITINNNLLYTADDGTDVLGLIAQNNINVGLQSADSLEIDGALIAKNGRVGRYYYSSYCGSTYRRTKISLYGMLASNTRYGFAYTDNTGYLTRAITYDGNLLYGPPPSFPLVSDQYQTISWKEVKE